MLQLSIAALFLTAGAALAQSGPELFRQGRYREAYAALWPALQAGEPEAAFYGLIIRRNGLDGRAPARPAEMAALWNILAANQERMNASSDDPSLARDTREAYRTALAQLSFFGPQAPAWPPRVGPEDRPRALAAARHLQAAAHDFTPAMNFLSFLDFNAHRGRQTQAFSRTLKAAEQGDHLAMGNAAWLYREGLGAEKNNLRAAHWARRAGDASPGEARGQNELGYCYESGRGVSRDPEEARNWYRRSAEQGHAPAKLNLERLESKRDAPPALDNSIRF
jgi:TPR repeat protein